MAQIKGYVAVAVRREKQAARLALIVARAAQAAKDGFSDVMKALEDE